MATQEGTAKTDATTPINPRDDVGGYNTEYVTLGDEEHGQEEDLATKAPKHVTFNSNQAFYTKYESVGMSFLAGSGGFFIVWIGYIFYNFIDHGLLTSYCKDPNTSCDAPPYNYDSPFYPQYHCCIDGGVEDTCYDTSGGGCKDISKTIATFFAQLLLIGLIIFQIYLLFDSSKKGMEIYKPEIEKTTIDGSTGFKSKLKNLLAKYKIYNDIFESKKINCRSCAYKEKDTPQKTAVNFLWNSMTILSLLRLLKEAPTILLNIFTGDSTLRFVGIAMLIMAIGNILQVLYANYCCCCNPCRGKCCCQEDCCCDCCCRCLSCKCCCDGHFPPHHLPYVEAVANVMNYSMYTKVSSALSQITAVGFIASTTEWHLWLTCFNFASGALTVFGVFKVYWRYYYLLCFYWSRMSVNKYESYKIHDLLNSLLKGAYVFKIEVKQDDEFVRVGDDEEIANKVWIKWDCFSIFLLMNMMGLCGGYVYILWSYTDDLNQGFNIDEGYGSPF